MFIKKPHKILIFTRYPAKGASSRLRIIQYLPYFEGHNMVFSLAPFFNERYLEDLYSNKKLNLFNLMYLFFKRFILLLSVYRYDLVWIEKEIFPYMPSFLESLIKFFKIKYIVDYDDAIFHNYDKLNSKFYKKNLMIF